MTLAARDRLFRGGALLALFAALWYFTPPALPVCGFRWLTGRPCPLCGLTRAMFALAKGHFGEALRLHALSPIAAALLIALVWDRPVPRRLWTPCAALFAAYGLWRLIT